jgi:phage terminase large subunit-like protein
VTPPVDTGATTGRVRANGSWRPATTSSRRKRARTDWTIWLVWAARRGQDPAGAEWIKGIVHGAPWLTAEPARRIALVGETFADARNVMVEGPVRPARDPRRPRPPAWSPSRRRLEWPNGAVAHVFSAEDPGFLRGPQFDAAWADEVAKWRYVDETWDMLQFGLRLGARPREIVTTTPRPIPLLKRLLADPKVATSRSRTQDNAANLAPAFLDHVVGRYAGTRLGRQELDGDIIEDRPDASGPAISWRRAARIPRRRWRASWWPWTRPPPRRSGRMPAASWRRGWTRAARPMCWRTPPRRASSRPNGRRGPSRSYRRLQAERLSWRRTRAARWPPA